MTTETALETIATSYWHRLDDGRLQCDLCPRYCKLKEGQQGLCYVRARENDQIVWTTYGRSSGFCIDPIEKKPLNHFLPGTPVLSFGTAGCNLACKFCQNWDISKSRQMDTLADQASAETIANAAKSLGCRSVAFTYNDPVIFLEYAVDVAKACRAHDIKTVAVTAGYICEQPRQDFFQHIDAANIDLKAFNDEFYFKVTGAHLQPVLDTLVYLKQETDVWFEITTLLIPGKNDSPEELRQIAEWIRDNLGADSPWHVTKFFPAYQLSHLPPTPNAIIDEAAATGREIGLQHVYAHTDISCDCATENLPVSAWLESDADTLNTTNKCAASCCGDEGILVKKFEKQAGLFGEIS